MRRGLAAWFAMGAGVLLGACERDAGPRDPDTGWQWAPERVGDDFEEETRFTIYGKRDESGTCIYVSEAELKEGEDQAERVMAIDTLRCRFVVARGHSSESRRMAQQLKKEREEMDAKLRAGAQEGKESPNF